MVTRQLRIYGLVQGVFFRDSLCRVATAHRVRGWVRNRSDGSVEALLQGQAEDVAQVEAWARRGPQRARVDRVDVRVLDHPEDLEGFQRLPTL